MTTDNKDFSEEKSELQHKKTALVLRKRELEMKLLATKNLVRSGGRLPNEKYKQCCDSQVKHGKDLAKIESELSTIKHRLSEIADIEYDAKNGIGNNNVHTEQESNVVEDSQIIRELVSLRHEYQNFAADPTRVSSMRQMAAEFVVKLNPIIKRAIGTN